MGMGLAAADQPGCGAFAFAFGPRIRGLGIEHRLRRGIRVPMAGQLLNAQRRGANSAGNTRPPPSTPRLPGLRRGSHNAPHSTAKYGWPLLTTRQTEDGCVIHHCRQKTYRCVCENYFHQ